MSTEEQAAKQIIDAINALSLKTADVANRIANDHPTLQQDFMRLCLYYIQAQSLKERGIDLRNEDTVKIAKKIASHLEYEEFYLRRI